MLKVLLARLQQKYRTSPYPRQEPKLPDRFRGRPLVDASRCPADCRICSDLCPTDAICHGAEGLRIDLGLCLFCGECACPRGAIVFSNEYRLSARSREALVTDCRNCEPAEILREDIRRLFGRSLKLRQVSAGGCNACEADINVLGTPFFDLGRFGIQMVASPRHADGLLITGPVSSNMRLALQKTYDAVPAPKIVIACGACAISGGPFAGHEETTSGVREEFPVDLFIPGCPPHPMTILDGLLRLTRRLKGKR